MQWQHSWKSFLPFVLFFKAACNQASDILFVLCSKNNRNICQKQHIKIYNK